MQEMIEKSNRETSGTSRRYDAVIFDLDGTLLDTLDDLAASANAAMEHCGMGLRTREEVRSFVGNGIRNLIWRMLPDGEQEAHFEDAFSFFKEHYAAHCMDRTKPYPGILPFLEQLKAEGYGTAIVSNKADFAVKKLNALYFQNLIGIAIGEHEGAAKKPAPDLVNEALAYLQIPAGRALYIGDSEVDIQTAANAGLDAVIVTWGFREKTLLQKSYDGPFADTVEELLTKIR
jgi:phosphoglycolate phosphatase